MALNKQVADLKEELANQSFNQSISQPVKKDANVKTFEKLKSEMDQNFQKEIENRKNYHEIEKNIIDAGLWLFQYKTEYERSMKENGKSHVKTKQAEDNLKTEQRNIDKWAEKKKKLNDALLHT